MSKNITTNARANKQVAILHLFEFEMHNFDGTFKETLRFTDHDIFVVNGALEYTPLAITFDTLSENGSMQSDSINISIDNVSGAITSEALGSEWRNNKASISRVIYTPQSEIIDEEVYEYGYGQNLDAYPKLDLANTTKDIYVLFGGIIDAFSATEQTLSGTITSLFTNWNKPYPVRTFNQNEFTTIVDTMTDSLLWGR